ncbi:MAG: porin family protein [Rhodospirillaceae bacterium]|nr:porin family protein [Rhodospirillales bacterium]
MKRVVFLAAMAVSTLVAASAEAGQWYVRADAGYGVSADTELKERDCAGTCGAPVKGDLGDGGSIGVGVGYQVKPWLRTDVTATYRGGYRFDGNAVGGGNYQQDFDAVTGMVNGYVDIRGLTKTKMGAFHPYVGAGIGVSHNQSGHAEFTNASGPGEGPDGSRTDFAWSLTAGSGIMVIKDKLMFDVAYHYTDLGRAGVDSGSFVQGGVSTPVNGGEANIQLHEITAGLRYMF